MSEQAAHWADSYAERIVREKGEKERYTCASGITPSGTVHIGNFREIISVELVVRALRDRGKQVRFLYSWDDYDVFRKVPKNMPKQKELAEYLRYPITMVPDPFGNEESYARLHEVAVERMMPEVGIEPEYLYQARKYGNSEYAQGMRTALEHRETIRGILNEHRTTPLEEDWWPVSVFSSFTNRDTTTVLSWDGAWGLTYRCDETGNEETIDLRTAKIAKLFWRVDWPMRWAHEGVDFEPAGKEHHSAGGSFDTAKRIVKDVYGTEPPVTFKYDFISIKGMGGKISSSAGNVISLEDMLEIYQPEIVRYLFVSTRPNAEFAISFDLDVLKIYEDYDRCERIRFGSEEVGDKRREKESRIYELSQVHEVPAVQPPQVPLRHLCNLLQVQAGDIDAALRQLDIPAEHLPRVRRRAQCAWNWLQKYAPEDFRFELVPPDADPAPMEPKEQDALRRLRELMQRGIGGLDEKRLSEELYSIAHASDLESKEFFRAVYRALTGKEQGPRLANFILTIGERGIADRLQKY